MTSESIPRRPRRRKTRSLTLIVRTWTRRTSGDTYFTVAMIVNGREVHRTERACGKPSDACASAAARWLADSGYIPDYNYGDLRLYCKDKGRRIVYYAVEIAVAREKDL